MKVCFISLSAYPLFQGGCSAVFGGAEVQLFNIATGIAVRDNVTVDFIVGDFGQGDQEVVKGVTLIKSVKVKQRPGFGEKAASALRQLSAFLRSNSDIYVQRSAGIQTGLLALFCSVFQRRFVYMTAHEWDCDGSYVRDNGFLGKIYEWGLRHADVVITQNDKQKKDLEDNYHIHSTILKSGYDFSKIKSTSKENFILWVARLDRWKQPEIFLDLVERFPEKNFVMIAPASGDGCYSEELRKRADGIQNLRYISGLPFQETEEYFGKANIFVNTSKFEGFPNTFIQALMHRTPVLSLSVNPDGVLEKYGVGYCANNCFESLIRYLTLLTDDKNLYEATAGNAFEYSRKYHDIKTICDQFSRIIGLHKA